MKCNYDITMKRIVAFIIDFFIATIIQALGFWCILLNFSKMEEVILVLFIWTMFVLLLLIGKDIIGGQSIGKRILTIGVRDLRDETMIPSVSRLLLRNVLLILWPIEIFAFFGSKGNMRLGDKLLNTTVINVL